MRTIGVLGFLVLSGCTASMAEPIELCEGDACGVAEGKADFDFRRVVRDGDSAPPFSVRVHRPITFEAAGSGLVAEIFVAGQVSHVPRSGVFCTLHRGTAGTLERTSRLYLRSPWLSENGDVFFNFVTPNPEDLEFISCARIGGGEITYRDVENAFYSASDGAKLAFEPLASFPYGSVIATSEAPTTSSEAYHHCGAIGGRSPWTMEIETLLEQGYGGFDPQACYWASNPEGALRFSENGVREERSGETARSCFALCVQGYQSAIQWGEHRATIEAALAQRDSGSYSLLGAERELRSTEGLTQVVDVQRDVESETFDVYYTNDAGDRCARIHVDGYDLRTDLDVCGE